MKVTVCFGNVRVVVPCGDGDFPIKDLIDKAVTRYKKAIGQANEYWVTVHNLKSFSDGGILDIDDILSDVADDREQIVAMFEEQGGVPHHAGGDGTSASSVGTASPDMFNGGGGFRGRGNDVLITHKDINGAHSGLLVRRGSEPALNQLGTDLSPGSIQALSPIKLSKRSNTVANVSKKEADQTSEQTESQISFSTFARSSSRKSLTNNVAMVKWLEAQEKNQERHEQQVARKEPLGQSSEVEDEFSRIEHNDEDLWKSSAVLENVGHLVVLPNSSGPLGIHVLPDFDEHGRDMGLVIQSIDPAGRVHADGRLKVNDCIIEINGKSLVNVDFSKSQEIFKVSLIDPELRLRVIDSEDRPEESPSPPSRRRPPEPPSEPPPPIPSKPPPSPTSPDGKKTPPAVPARAPTTSLSNSKGPLIAPSNTRRIGKKITIQLTKGGTGLGFSVTTRDNPAGGNCPIYIKNIMPKGAAIEDGRLKPGDRLLEVNGAEMTGKNQTEAVSVLRQAPLNSVVLLVVSRQIVDVSQQEDKEMNNNEVGNEPSDSTDGAREHESHDAESEIGFKEVLTLQIPLDGTSGLGVNVKGKVTPSPDGALREGIFIKSVLSDGAAAMDGRLRINDQLMAVNQQSLVGLKNIESMEVLRKAMTEDAPFPGHIQLIVARSKSPFKEPNPQNELRVSSSDAPNSFSVPVTPLEPFLISSPTKRPTNPYSELKNPALDRLSAGYHLRNTSYQRATHDSIMGESMYDPSVMATPPRPQHTKNLRAPTVSGQLSRDVMIENDAVMGRLRPASSSGIPMAMKDRTEHVSSMVHSRSSENLTKKDEEEEIEAKMLLKKWESNDVVEESTLSPPTDEDAPGFSREGFGRRSMSEKRKGHSDPAASEFYQKIKQNKFSYSMTWDPRRSAFRQVEELLKTDPEGTPEDQNEGLKRISSAESLTAATLEPPASEHEYILKYIKDDLDRGFTSKLTHIRPVLRHTVGPTLGLKKSSSLESLQTAVQEVTMDEGSAKSGCGRKALSRTCNESFRAAVDRSYEAQDAMETVDEEKSELGSDSQGTQSRTSSLSAHDIDLRKSSKKKDKGIFKGLGSVFRFGKPRKANETPAKLSVENLHTISTPAPVERKPEESVPSSVSKKQAEMEKQRARAQMEQQKINEQYRKLQEKQRQMDAQQDQAKGTTNLDNGFSDDSPAGSRAEKIHHLRAAHQRRHRERQGQYPKDQEEEIYERSMQEFEESRLRATEDGHSHYAVPPRRRVDDSYRHSQQQPPEEYSHYANFQEIRDQLRRHDNYQEQYRMYMQQQVRTPKPMGPPPPQSMRPPPPQSMRPLPQMTEPRRDPRRELSEPQLHSARTEPRHDPRNMRYDRPMSHSHLPSAQTPISQVAPGYYQKQAYDPRLQPHSRKYADYDDPTRAYPLEYGSLPRRRPDHHVDHNGLMSSSAQV